MNGEVKRDAVSSQFATTSVFEVRERYAYETTFGIAKAKGERWCERREN